MWQEGNKPFALMVFGIDVFVALLVIYRIVKQYNKNYKNTEE